MGKLNRLEMVDNEQDSTVEKYIRELTKKAKFLIDRQQGNEPEEAAKKGRAGKMGQSVTGARLTQVSVNLDGSTTNILASSQKSAAIRKAIGLARDDEEYQAPKRFFE